MHVKRLLGSATAAVVLLAGPLSGAAQAQAGSDAQTGVGSGKVSSTVLGIDLGSLLNLALLDDEGLSSIDPVNGVPAASSVLNPLNLTGTLLGDKSLAGVTTSTAGAEDAKSSSVDPAVGGIPLPVVDGVLNGTLSSVVDGDGARSNLLAGIGGDGLSMVGGLVGLGGASDASTFATKATPGVAGGISGLNIPSLDLLNLGNLLAGAGSPLESLPLDTLTGLLGPLGIDSVPVAGVAGGTMDPGDIVESVTSLAGAIGALGLPSDLTATDMLTSDQCGAADGALAPLGGLTGVLPGLPVDLCGTTAALTPVLSIVTRLVDQLTPILDGVLPALDGLNLLSAQDITAGMQATATDSLDNSVADVVASIGTLNVAGMDTPLTGLDLTQNLAGVSGTINGILNGALGGLLNLDVDVLQIDKLVAPDGDYTTAFSSLSALAVNVLPVSPVAQAQAAPLPSAVDIVPTGLPGTGGAMADLLSLDALSGVTSLLTEGLGINAGTMQASGSFNAVAGLAPSIVTPPPAGSVNRVDGKLPRTGTNTALPALIGVVLVGAALGLRRLTAKEEPTD